MIYNDTYHVFFNEHWFASYLGVHQVAGIDTLQGFDMAMDNGPFHQKDDAPIKYRDSS